MNANIKEIKGNWDKGYALDKHTLRSVFMGNNQFGHPTFETIRSEAGEALCRLKYGREWIQTASLAQAVVAQLIPRFGKIGLIVPMPASNVRAWQPVTEVARAIATTLKVPVFENIVVAVPASGAQRQLKNMHTKEEKATALAGRFALNEAIENEGRWNALLLDDLFDTGASMEAACAVLRTYRKIAKIYAAALTWK